MKEEKRRYTGICIDCGGPSRLFELDVQKGTKILRCQRCGLLHRYKKGFFGGWKFLKAFQP